jgi:murein L,D-transpeptidase YcbB/YkuD
MPALGVGWKTGCVALLFVAWRPLCATADDAPPPSPAATVSPLDPSPTGALKPQLLENVSTRNVSRLDLSTPPGFLPGLPPEAPPPSFDSPTALHTLVGSVGAERQAADTDALAPASAPGAESAAVAPGDVAQPLPPPAAGAAPPPKPDVEPAVPIAAPSELLGPERTSADPLANAIRAALDHVGDAKPQPHPIGAGDWVAAQKAIVAVYAEGGYAPLWLDGDHWSVQAKSALDRLAKAGEDGLNLAESPTPPADWSDGAPQAQAQADVALSAAVVAYALQASGARIYPRALSKDVSARPDLPEPGAALKSVAAAEDPDMALAAFNPPQAGYQALRTALAALRAEATAPAAQWAPGPVLKLGMSDPRVPLIRSRFGLGSLSDEMASQVYDIRVASAVAAFQRVHGLPPNGALTEATAAALAGGGDPSVRRERLILANMEMWRWEPRDLGETRVEVNVPDFTLKLTQNGAVVLRTRVIVGKPDSATPIFSNSIKYMLFNPIWRVPESIVKKEMAPKYAADPDYFERHGYKVSYDGDKLEVEQPPGEANALGRMLFLFPNEHAVYLHDTPQRSLFASGYRALSHGCVRVEDPARLAVLLMGGAARGWTESKLHSLIGDKERTLALPVPVPVHLEYFTEFVDDSGKLREREDLYGLAGKVASALAKLRRD